MKQGFSKAQIFEAIDAVLRSWWTVVAGVSLGLAGAFTLLHFTDPVYEATTKIFVAPQKIPRNMIRGTVSDDIEARLRSLKDSVLSRPYMLNLIDETFPATAEGEDLEKRIKSIRSRVQVGTHRERSFQIRYRDTDPQRAAAVVNVLADHYIAENARYRTQRAEETTGTLRELAEDAAARLEEKQEAIEAYKAKNRFTLSDQLGANLQLLKGRQLDLDANEKATSAARDRLLDLEAQQERDRATQRAMPEAVPTDAPYADRLKALNDELMALKLRYSESHPDYKKKLAEIEALREEAQRMGQPTTPPGSGEAPPANARPLASSIEGRILAAQREISRLEKDRVKIRSEISEYESRIERTPAAQQELDNLTRGLSVLQRKYNEYQSKMEEAAGAEKMEEAQQGSQFEVIERAVPPVIPVTPDRKRIFIACFGAGLLLFVGPILAMSFLRPVIHSEAGLIQLSDVNLLVTIPKIETPEKIRSARLRWAMNIGFSALSAAVLVTVVVVLR